MRTFNDWNDPPPGFFDTDMVAHCGACAGMRRHSLMRVRDARSPSSTGGLV